MTFINDLDGHHKSVNQRAARVLNFARRPFSVIVPNPGARASAPMRAHETVSIVSMSRLECGKSGALRILF